jgi:hydroxypyruvate reductase
MAMKPHILLTQRNARVEQRLGESFTLHFMTDYANRTECIAAVGDRISGIYYSGSSGAVRDSLFERMPKLEIVTLISAGYDYVDIVAARDRGIIVTSSGGSNSVDAAEFAFGLLLNAGRNIHGGDRHVRSGLWGEQRFAPTRRLSGRPLGILGLGNIGREIARRAAAFDMPVFYHSRRARLDVPYTYLADPMVLAREVELMIVALPGGPETRCFVDRAMMDALGPDGVLVNIGRGSVVDEEALIAALTDRTLGAAGLDVLENEPDVPPALAELPNVVLTPHQASNTPDAMRSAVDHAIANMEAHFAGRPVSSPVT